MSSISNEDLAYIQRVSSELAEKQHKNMGFNHVQSKPIIDFEDSDEIKAQNSATSNTAQFSLNNSVNRVDEILQGFETSINDDYTTQEHAFHAVTPKEAHLNKIKAEKALKMRKKQQKERLQQHRDELFKPIYTSETQFQPQQPLFPLQQQFQRPQPQAQTEQPQRSQTQTEMPPVEIQTLLEQEQTNMEVLPKPPKTVKNRETKPKTPVTLAANRSQSRQQTRRKTQNQPQQDAQNASFQPKTREKIVKNELKQSENSVVTLDMLIERLVALKSQVLGSTPIFVDNNSIIKVVNNGENIVILTKKEG